MGVTIPLPELDVTKPAPAPPPDALAEFQRAASLQTDAARQQAIQAQTTGQNQTNQAQALALKDEMTRRELAPQFVQKDANGKPTGFDTEGLYNAMLQQGADPANIATMRMKQVEMQKSLIGLSDAQLAHQDKVNDEIANSLNSVRDIQEKTASKSPSTPLSPSPVGGAENPLGPPVPGTGGMPAAMLPNVPAAQALLKNQPGAAATAAATPVITGKAPAGTPESLGNPEPGTVPTSTEAALQDSAANAPKPITPEAQTAYQKELIRLHAMGIPIGNFKPVLTDERDLDQAAAELGLHKQMMSEASELAKTQEAAGRGAQAQAEARKANEIPFPELGGIYDVAAKEFRTVAGNTMSPAMLEGKYVLDQAHKNANGQSPDPEFDKAYEHMKTLVPTANINLGKDLLNDPAKDMAAENYFQTGQLPAGARSPGLISSIINRAAQLHPEGGLAGNKAAYAANASSLRNVTGTLDTLTAFENTGLRNLKQFTDLTDKLPDTGVPWLNTPVRSLDKNLVGDQWMPAVEAARTVALREIARVTNDPKLSGALTDTARAEVTNLSPQNATMNQIKNVVKVLQNDMANVHSSLAMQRDDIQKRINAGGGGSSEANSPKTQDWFSTFGGQARPQ